MPSGTSSASASPSKRCRETGSPARTGDVSCLPTTSSAERAVSWGRKSAIHDRYGHRVGGNNLARGQITGRNADFHLLFPRSSQAYRRAPCSAWSFTDCVYANTDKAQTSPHDIPAIVVLLLRMAPPVFQRNHLGKRALPDCTLNLVRKSAETLHKPCARTKTTHERTTQRASGNALIKQERTEAIESELEKEAGSEKAGACAAPAQKVRGSASPPISRASVSSEVPKIGSP